MDELYLPANSAAEAASIDRMNSTEAAAIKATRLALVKEKGRVEEADMPDTRAKMDQAKSVARLLTSARQKLRTTMIGAISAVEETLGRRLWGFGKEECDCTEQELWWRNHWNACRTRILDNGNTQIRSLERELEER